jgi:hypothetical protein
MDEDDDDLELNRVVDKTFPALAAEEIFAAFRSGAYHDAVWRCNNGTCFKVHRFVLAMGSPFLRYNSGHKSRDNWIFAAFCSGAYHDAVWRCSNGGSCFKVHRFLLAMGSPFLRYNSGHMNHVTIGFQCISAIRVLVGVLLAY